MWFPVLEHVGGIGRGRCVTEANLRIATFGLNFLFVRRTHRIFNAPSN